MKILFNLSLAIRLASALVASLALPSTSWALLNSLSWETLEVPRDREATFAVERKLRVEANLKQTRQVLVNYKERGRFMEKSAVFEYEFDCLWDRYKASKATLYLSEGGKGEVLKTYSEGQLGMAGGFGVQAAMKSVCDRVMQKKSSLPATTVPAWDFPIHHLLDCNDQRYKDTKAYFLQIRERAVPSRKIDGAWIYAASEKTGGYELNLPAKEIWLGVCYKNGDTDCGASRLTGIAFDLPVEEVRKALQIFSRKSIDYTKELRDSESGATKRAHLITSRFNPKQALLYCDNGNL